MKNLIKNILIIAVFLTAFSSYSQMGPIGGDENDDVVDNAPIDDFVWVGLIAGVLVGVTAYALKKKQAA